MSKNTKTSTVPQSVRDNAANQTNLNKGTNGTNIAYDKAMGHRGAQIAARLVGAK